MGPEEKKKEGELAKKLSDANAVTAWVVDKVKGVADVIEGLDEKDQKKWQEEENVLLAKDVTELIARAAIKIVPGALEAAGDVLMVARAASGVLRVVGWVIEQHQKACDNDIRVAELRARLRELSTIIAQVRTFLLEEACSCFANRSMRQTHTALALKDPLKRLTTVVKGANGAIDDWVEVAQAEADGKWRKFKKHVTRVFTAGTHQDKLAEAKDKLRDALAELGHVAALRAALNTSSSWEDGMKVLQRWMKKNLKNHINKIREDMQELMDVEKDIRDMLCTALPEINEKLDSLHMIVTKNSEWLEKVNDRVVSIMHQLFEANVPRIDEDLLVGDLNEAQKPNKTAKFGGNIVSIKVVESSDDKRAFRRVYEEARLLHVLRHPNVTTFFGVCAKTEGTNIRRLVLVTEHEHTTVLEQLSKSEWSFIDRRAAVRGVATGLAFVHRMGIIHRQVASANILLTRSSDGNECVAKLAQFGVAKDTIYRASGLTTSEKTVADRLEKAKQYLAPELEAADATNFQWTKESDVFAFGVVVYEVLFKNQATQNDVGRKFKKEKKGLTFASKTVSHPQWLEVISKCVEGEREKRETMQKVEKLCKNLEV